MRISTRRLFVVAASCGIIFGTSACSSDDSLNAYETTSTPRPAPGMLSDAERRAAYAQFDSPERKQMINEVIKTCGDILLAKLNSGQIPAEKNGERRDEPAPSTGLGLFSIETGYSAGAGEPNPMTLAVYYVNGEVTEVHGIEVQYGDTMYTLRGRRVTPPEGKYVDNVGAYTWKLQAGDKVEHEILLGEDGSSVLHSGYDDQDPIEKIVETQASTLQALDNMFLRSLMEVCL